MDTSGFSWVANNLKPWWPTATLEEIRNIWQQPGRRIIGTIDADLADGGLSDDMRLAALITKATLFNYEGEPIRADETPGAGSALASKARTTWQKTGCSRSSTFRA